MELELCKVAADMSTDHSKDRQLMLPFVVGISIPFGYLPVGISERLLTILYIIMALFWSYLD